MLVGKSRGRAGELGEGGGSSELWLDRPGEEGGISLADIGQMPSPSLAGLAQGPRIRTSYFARADSPIIILLVMLLAQ